MNAKNLFAAAACVVLCAAVVQAADLRLPVGEFTATRFEKPPVIDGKVSPGEWDRAFTTTGLMTLFEHGPSGRNLSTRQYRVKACHPQLTIKCHFFVAAAVTSSRQILDTLY